jgi:two-component system, NtrC family, sensor histidine kinase HydH
MKTSRLQGVLSLPKVLLFIVGGMVVLSLLFFTFWQRLNRKVEDILKEQFNQQQLELARKIADNVEAYFDYLESELLAYPWRFRLMPVGSPEFDAYMAARFENLERLGILQIRLFDSNGRLKRSWKAPQGSSLPVESAVGLEPSLLNWVKNPQNRGRLFLGEVHRATAPPWQGRLVMPLITALYKSPSSEALEGALELLIDPLVIARLATAGVRSGATGYPWIIDQNGVLLAHHEPGFIGRDALEVRRQRSPQMAFAGLSEIQERLLKGEEGLGGYVSGWHRQRVGETPKLAAYTPIRFDKGLIRSVTDVENPAHNLWGVAVVAPVDEVAGQVSAVTRQELFLVAFFFLAVILVPIALIIVALSWNKVLAREVNLKTDELLESQKRLVRSERFAAVGEAAAYVSHEIKNPLMVIGGLARQVQKKLEGDPSLTEKLEIIRQEVQRLENLLGEIRDFTRPATPVKQEIDLNTVIHEVDALLEGEAKTRGISLEEHLDPHLPPLQADPNQMRQVLLNLVKNAFEALDSGGRVTLRSGAEDRQVWFAVQDTGVGMSPEVLDKIFNPFFTTKEKGSGLGLAVIHKIVSDHHGVVNVKSSPEQGTTVTVKIPCEPEAASSQAS